MIIFDQSRNYNLHYDYDCIALSFSGSARALIISGTIMVVVPMSIPKKWDGVFNYDEAWASFPDLPSFSAMVLISVKI